MSGEVVHFAGLDLEVDGRRLRQRCAWCGEILLDVDLSTTAKVIAGRKPPAWPVGALVLLGEGFGTIVEPEVGPEGGQVPERSCYRAEFPEFEEAIGT